MKFKELLNKAKSAKVGTEGIFNNRVAMKVRQQVKHMKWKNKSSTKAFVRLVIRYNMHLVVKLDDILTQNIDDQECIDKLKENEFYVSLTKILCKNAEHIAKNNQNDFSPNSQLLTEVISAQI